MASYEEIQALNDLLNGKKRPEEVYNRQPEVMQLPDMEIKSPYRPAATGVPKTPAGKYALETQKQAIDERQQAAQDFGNRAAIRSTELEDIRSKLLEPAPEPEKYVADPERMKKISDLNDKLSQSDAPQRDMWTQAILSLGPGLLGAVVGGDAGHRAALPTQQAVEKSFGEVEKMNLSGAKQEKEKIIQQMKALQQMESKAQADFKDQRNLGMRYREQEIAARTAAANAVGQDKKELERLANEAAGKASSYVMQTAKDVPAVDKAATPKPKGAAVPKESALDRNFAKTYEQYVTSGGFSKTEKNLSELEPILKTLKSGKGTGAMGFAPDAVRAVFDKENLNMQQKVEQVVTETLRQTFGAQFTEREGTNFIRRAFDPRLTPAQNAEKLEAVITDIKTRAKAIEAAAKYYEDHGNRMQGYKGTMEIGESAPVEKKQGLTPEQRKKLIEDIQAAKKGKK